MATISEEIVAAVNQLPVDKQRNVLEYARRLAQNVPPPRSPLPPGPPASAFLAFTPTVPPEVVDEMERAIEENCEGIASDDDDLSF